MKNAVAFCSRKTRWEATITRNSEEFPLPFPFPFPFPDPDPDPDPDLDPIPTSFPTSPLTRMLNLRSALESAFDVKKKQDSGLVL